MLKDKGDKADLKLIDFGLAKRFCHSDDHMQEMVGTPYYISPGVLSGDYTMKCDVWSLGVIMYICCSGYPPFNGSNNQEIFNNILKSEPSFADTKIWNRMSSYCKDLLKNMLIKDYNMRPSIEQCLEHQWFSVMQTNQTEVDENTH